MSAPERTTGDPDPEAIVAAAIGNHQLSSDRKLTPAEVERLRRVARGEISADQAVAEILGAVGEANP